MPIMQHSLFNLTITTKASAKVEGSGWLLAFQKMSKGTM